MTTHPSAHRPHRALQILVALLAAVVLGGCAAPVRVTWKTETEMNTAGFNLYRGTSPDGPFEQRSTTS